MAKRSAGLLMFRKKGAELEVFLVHPGGPFWAAKDAGAWTVPKGEYIEGEKPLEAAKREFTEETGFAAEGEFIDLGTVRQTSGKLVNAWAFEGDCDPEMLVSNLCEIEWPPRSGKKKEIPEVDRGAWFTLGQARQKILSSQVGFLDVLEKKVHSGAIRE
ncbi:NUDIX domain-containing protein [Occallatibacter savannae]|uniref:NUDIX domain-containing protein n=1 Tax=Occallatibacter savannae TaxID=1002691 RepID=UPI000D68A7D5|nr:NUDIX domain-containing protein [Occallatibacter savannae]